MADANKTEKATPHRRKKAREEGQVARTRELPNVLAWIGSLVLVSWQISSVPQQWRGLFLRTVDLSWREPVSTVSPVLFWTAIAVLRWIVPILATAWVLSMAGSLAQGGLVFAPSALAFKVERLNPAHKLGQMFSLSGLSNILKSLLPFGVILWIGLSTADKHWAQILTASGLRVNSYVSFLLGMIWEVIWKSAIVLFAWAGIDYFLVWQKLEGDLKMSREELREESKQNDGNPAIKGQIRRLQRQMRRRHMLKAAEKASVVITNPTHFAVAIKYEMDMEAPIVIAKGQNLLAQQIKEIARWNNIPTIENPPLAQTLYRTVDVGKAIPAALYTAVAEILAFVYRAQAQASRQQSSGARR
jgi:flagellar biosynthetic protein FlhB